MPAAHENVLEEWDSVDLETAAERARAQGLDEIADLGRLDLPAAGVDDDALADNVARRRPAAEFVRLEAEHYERRPWLPDGDRLHLLPFSTVLMWCSRCSGSA